jgi:hypothetical protein
MDRAIVERAVRALATLNHWREQTRPSTISVNPTRRVRRLDFYEWRMGVALEQLSHPDYPAGVIQWLAAFSPALHQELTSRLPNKIQRLWEARAPIPDFEAACTELIECHRSAIELFRRHRSDNHQDQHNA